MKSEVKNEFRRKNTKIEKRNKRVELDKRWETSYTRKICIIILTYIIVISYSYLVRNNNNIFLSSLIPVIGFGLSTLSLRIIRKIWEKKQLINDYIENVNLSELEWETFEIEELSEFIYENYKSLIEEGLDVFGFPFIKFLNYIDLHNSYDSRGLRIMCDDHKFLLGVVNNKLGKKTIAGAIVYDEIYHDSLGACEIPVTRVLGIEVNSFFQKNGIYPKMCDKFIDVVSKNRHIVMYNDDELYSEKENESTKRLFNKIKQSAENKGFPNEVIYYNYIDKIDVGIPISNTQRVKK